MYRLSLNNAYLKLAGIRFSLIIGCFLVVFPKISADSFMSLLPRPSIRNITNRRRIDLGGFLAFSAALESRSQSKSSN
jgi:hypothetical protein